MRILFIKLKHIGDTLILTPTLVAVKQAHPDAEIWVMVRRGCEEILAGCPEVNEILLLPGVEKSERTFADFWRQVALVCKMWRVRFDYVFELGDGHRGRLFAWMARTSRRYSVKPSTFLKIRERGWFTGISTFDGKTCHQVEKDYRSTAEFLSLPETIPPLRFEASQVPPWEKAKRWTDFCLVQIGTRQAFNRWHREGWRSVCAGLLERFENVVVTCGTNPQEVEEGVWLEEELGSRVICTRGLVSWSQMAEMLRRARLYVGLPTAAMHLAAACECPAVGIFARTIEEHWSPWRSPHRSVSENSCLRFTDPEERYQCIKKRTTDGVRPDDILRACDELLLEVTAKHLAHPNASPSMRHGPYSSNG